MDEPVDIDALKVHVRQHRHELGPSLRARPARAASRSARSRGSRRRPARSGELPAVEDIGPRTEVSTFTGPKPAAWWTRRRLHEATVHRADATIALGAPYELPAELAADGISGWLDRLADQQALGQQPSLPAGASLALRATDPGLTWKTWTVLGGPGACTGTADQSAPTSLFPDQPPICYSPCYGGRPADTGISMQGDTALWHSWLAQTPL